MQTALMLLVVCVSGLIPLVLVGCDGSPKVVAQGASLGEDLFNNHCAVCHRAGAAGRLDPSTWQGGQGKLASEKVFRAYLRDTGNVMPSIPESVLSDKEVGVLYAYLTKAEGAQTKAQP